MALSALSNNPLERPMLQSNDLSRSFTALNQDSTLIVVIEMSQSSWLVAGMVPGIERQPLKKLKPDEDQLLKLMDRWRHEAIQAGREIERVVVAYEAGRDGFWLARWLRERGVEAYVIHPSSIAVSREHRRAKTDRLDTELLMRAFLGWLRGEKRHCSMAAIPTVAEEDVRRPSRERETLVGERTRLVNRVKAILARFGIRAFKPNLRKAANKLDGIRTAEGTPLPANTRAELRRYLARLRLLREHIHVIQQERLHPPATAPPAEEGSHAMVRLLAQVVGIGIETADLLVHEVLSRKLRDRRAVGRDARLPGAPGGRGGPPGGKGPGAAREGPGWRGLDPIGPR